MSTEDRDPHKAVDYIIKNAKHFAKAKAERVYIEEYRKSSKAMLMKKAIASKLAKSSAAAEMEAYSDPSYIELLKGIEAAVQMEEELRWALVSAQARIEVFRTVSANDRAVDKAVM